MVDTTETTPRPTATKPSGQPDPSPMGWMTEHLGNILIGTAIVLAFVLVLGWRYAASTGEEQIERERVDAEFAFSDDRFVDAELDIARQTLDNERDITFFDECEDDGDAESRFADEDCVPADERRGLFNDVDDRDDIIDFDRFERPILRHELSDRGSSRILELSIWVEDGRSDIEIAIDARNRVLLDGDGAAIRTSSNARSLSNTRLVTVEPSERCDDGCNVTLWVTLGFNFDLLYPDAELVVFGDRSTEVSVEDLDRLPRQAFR